MKTIALLAAFALTMFMAAPAQATSGRTDRCGCHHSNRAGYHCHGVNRCKAPTPTPPLKPKKGTR